MDKIICYMKNNEKKIFEMIIMSLISGWFITAIINKTYIKMTDLHFVTDANKVTVFLVIFLVSCIVGIIYMMEKIAASLILFSAVFAYSVLVVYNNKESLYLAIAMAIISALAVIYIRKDIISLTGKVKLNDKTALMVVIAMGLTLAAFIGGVTALRYCTYSNSTYDFGIFAQMFQNMKNTGHAFTSVEREGMGNLSHFAVHFSPIFYLVLPVYWLFPSPITVQLIQAVALGAAVVPLYYLCRHYKMSEKFSIMMCGVYCLFPAVASGTYYDFHENCFIPLLLLLFILAFEKKNNIMMFFSGGLLLLVKEDAALYILIVGVYMFLSRRDKKRGIIVSIAALIYFVVAIAIVNSYGLGDLASTRYGNVMYDTEGSIVQVIVVMLMNPGYMLKEIASEEKVQYILLMFLPLGMSVFQNKHYSRYILLGTLLMFNIIPSYQYQYDIGFQYNFGAVVLLLYIAIMTVTEWGTKRRAKWGLTTLVVTSILFASFTMPRLSVYVDRYNTYKQTYKSMDVLVELIPEESSALVSGFFMPHLYYLEDVTVINAEVEVVQDYVLLDLRGNDEDEITGKLYDYTVIGEVPDTMRLYKKNSY